MRLLVSVCNAAEAIVALGGGADIVDAKDPSRGALGPVSLDVMRQIGEVCRGTRVTAALGESMTPDDAEAAAVSFVRAGASLVKIGFADAASEAEMTETLDAAVSGARIADARAGVVAVAFVDAGPEAVASPASVVRAASATGASGVLLDTIDKTGPGLRGLMSLDGVVRWVAEAHRAGLTAAVAGKLGADDIEWLVSSGVDIVGVRGAACVAGRGSRIDRARVTALRARCSLPALL